MFTHALGQLAPYGVELGTMTDLYQLTMGAGYFEKGLAEREAAFFLHGRKHPFGASEKQTGGFTIAAGLAPAVDYLLNYFRYSQTDLDFLANLRGNDKSPIFKDPYLRYLGDMKVTLDLDGPLEGTAVSPMTPLLRVKGPLIQAQLAETALINLIGFQSLIATKAARIRVAAGRNARLSDFGLRRAQGFDGGLSASRAAYIGTFDATSNVLAGRLFGIPVKGTHAHAWVMVFSGELEAFMAYADVSPNNALFLVDTYNTIDGVRHAIEVARILRTRGYEILGVRLDSGDLTKLSKIARQMLDEAGFPNARIFATNDLDEFLIASMLREGAKIEDWGVGTRLVTAWQQPASGFVYKICALRDENGNWDEKVKLSNNDEKVSLPGLPQTRRYYDESGKIFADQTYNELNGEPGLWIYALSGRERRLARADFRHEDIAVPVLRHGELVLELPANDDSRQRTFDQLELLPEEALRFENPTPVFAGLDRQTRDDRDTLIEQFLEKQAA